MNLAKGLCDRAGPGEIEIGRASFGWAGAGVGAVTAVRTQLKGIATAVAVHRVTVSRGDLKLSARGPLGGAEESGHARGQDGDEPLLGEA